jgi:hypothetical protein
MQRGIRTGHSSYVEMHEANNLVIHNIKLRINSMKPFIDKELHEKLISILPAMLNGLRIWILIVSYRLIQTLLCFFYHLSMW